MKAMNNFLEEIISNESLAKLRGLAKRHTIDYFTNQKDFESALLIADKIFNEYGSDKNLASDALYVKGLILVHDLGKPDKAAESFEKIIKDYPESSLIPFVEDQLLQIGYEPGKNVTTNSDIIEFKTSNHPNPFNPITLINYSLPVDEKVIIKVYDILGREITTLVNEEKSAGTYLVNFDATYLASGIYFYSITAGKFTQTKKMILAK